jgi:hypothetical protein
MSTAAGTCVISMMPGPAEAIRVTSTTVAPQALAKQRVREIPILENRGDEIGRHHRICLRLPNALVDPPRTQPYPARAPSAASPEVIREDIES